MSKTAVIGGSSQGIGLALTKELLSNADFKSVIVTYRKESNIEALSALKEKFQQKLEMIELDISQPASFESMAHFIEELAGTIDLFINCIGVLTGQVVRAEKSISEASQESMSRAFQVNTLPTLMFAKYLRPLLLKSKQSVFIVLSAKVGSMEDNKTGGWYSYRVSKAALNMVIKNISIEFNRLGKKCTVFSVHPGTTDTELSAPFIERAKKKYIIHSAEETAGNILNIAFEAKNETHNGQFISWNGERIPW